MALAVLATGSGWAPLDHLVARIGCMAETAGTLLVALSTAFVQAENRYKVYLSWINNK